MSTFVLTSPAKLNLFLKVLYKRPDGFHHIETLFQRISLADEIAFTRQPPGIIKVTTDHATLPTGSKNLMTIAARLLLEGAGASHGAAMHLKKNIPIAAGLAGGSSNAATVIKGLNRLWGLGLSQEDMKFLSRKIGSDVAFFLQDSTWAVGTERGDCLTNVEAPGKALWQVLVVPRIKLYAGKVYEALNWNPLSEVEFQAEKVKNRRAVNQGNTLGGQPFQLTKPGDNVSICVHYLRERNIPLIGNSLRNDLEAPVLHLAPQLKILKERMHHLGAQGVLVSGSGPSVFGVVPTRREAQIMAAELAKRYSQVYVVKSL